MPRKRIDVTPVITEKKLAERHRVLDLRISRLVDQLLKLKGVSQTAFGRLIGFSQANISNVFNPGREANHWSMPLLIATSAFFGVSVGELLMAAESGDGVDSACLLFACCNTKPASRERLQRLVWAAEGYVPDRVKPEDRGLLELVYSVDLLELGTPDFCECYYAGQLNDARVLSEFKAALAFANNPDNLAVDKPPPPLWAALKQTWKGAV